MPAEESSYRLRVHRLKLAYYNRVRRWRQGSIRPFAGTVSDVDSSCDIGRLFVEHKGTMVHKWVHYLPAYAEQFERFRGRPIRFLEIGVSHGGSLQMWRSYFGDQATIFGIDVNPECAALNGRGGQVRIGSQADAAFLAEVVREMGGVDVVLDDGSHVAEHQRASFDALFPVLSIDGMYAIEDLHTAYWPKHGGGYRRRGTFIEVTKAIIDDMHHWYHGRASRAIPGGAAVRSVAIYDSIVFISKGDGLRPRHARVGEPGL